MMSLLAELLPLCFVRWYTKRFCEREMFGGKLCAFARYDVVIIFRRGEK